MAAPRKMLSKEKRASVESVSFSDWFSSWLYLDETVAQYRRRWYQEKKKKRGMNKRNLMLPSERNLLSKILFFILRSAQFI